MMGSQTGSQDRLFYSFNLDEHIPQNHLLRGIDQCLDLSELRKHLVDFYSHTGRPSTDPELMIRMLIVGYCYGIHTMQSKSSFCCSRRKQFAPARLAHLTAAPASSGSNPLGPSIGNIIRLTRRLRVRLAGVSLGSTGRVEP